METKTWIVIEIDHERYSFDTALKLEVGKTLQEVAAGVGANVSDLESFGSGDRYMWGGTYHRRSDFDNVDHIDIDVVLIVSLDEFLAEDYYTSWVWGETKNKFGLFDLKGEK